MRKTFCDRCGGECVNRTVIVSVAEQHTTAAGEPVATDEWRPVELCGPCGDAVKAGMPELSLGHHYDEADAGQPVAVTAAPG